MVDQNTFMETVREVSEMMRTSPVPMGQEEILGYLDDLKLNEQQKKIVMEYLRKQMEEPEPRSQDGYGSDPVADRDGTKPWENSTRKNGREENEDRLDRERDDAEGEESDELEENRLMRSKVFSMYLEELSELPSYSDEERAVLYRGLFQGEQQMVKKLADAWLPRVLSIAEGYVSEELLVEDLVQEGNMALLLKLHELCGGEEEPVREIEKKLARSIEKGIAVYASRISGEKEQEKAVIGRINLVHEACNLLKQELGRKPELSELGAFTKLPEDELKELLFLMEKQKNREGEES